MESSLQMQGILRGWAEVGETFERDDPSTYHNWILRGLWLPLTNTDPLPPFPLSLTHQRFQVLVLEGL